MQIVAVCHQKGEVGKTTLTIHLSAALARLGQRVLLVDLDPQGHLTEGVGLGEAYLSEQVSLYTALVGPERRSPSASTSSSTHHRPSRSR